VTRAAVRKILAVDAGCAPADLSFVEGDHGKPHLAAPGTAGDREFNVSHTGRLALVAVARDLPVGVDVEAVDRPVDPLSLGPRVLTPAERAHMAEMPPAEAARHFLRVWTAKEAVVKALGRGLSLPLTDFAVVEGPDEVIAIRCSVGCALPPLTLVRLHPDEAHVGALAVLGSPESIRFRCGSALFAP